MYDEIPNAYRLGVSLALFAVVGVVHAAVESTIGTLAATAIAVVGVYGVARYAGRISRPRLAMEALGLWLAFLAVAGLHAIGVPTVAGWVPLSESATVLAVSAFTWTTLLAAASTTVFLGFREYGATVGADVHDDGVLDGDSIR